MPPWLSGEGPDADVVVSSRVRLARNLAQHRFPGRASMFERAEVFQEVSAAFRETPQCSSFNPVSFSKLDKNEQRFLVEERLAGAGLENAEGERGIILDETRRVSVMVNGEDHLKLQILDAGLRPQELWGVVDAIDDAVGMRLTYAFDGRSGFLTCRPADAGTGLRASFLVHLPGLTLARSVDTVLRGAAQMGVSARGFLGEHSPVAGDLYALSNASAMGSTENAILDNTATVARHIAGVERKARQRLLEEAHLRLIDRIQRAWGVLCHARLLGVNEFLALASDLRLGIECNLFDKCTRSELNRLTLFMLPGHLRAYYKKTMDDEECRAARADLVRAFFKRKKTGKRTHENG